VEGLSNGADELRHVRTPCGGARRFFTEAKNGFVTQEIGDGHHIGAADQWISTVWCGRGRA
jgi:hypothetical protein